MRNTFEKILIALVIIATGLHSAKAQGVGEPDKGAIAHIKTEEISYEIDGVKQKGYVAYVPNDKAKLPIVLVVPEWWGYNDYAKMRARKLAELGYIAMVVDMYGNGKEAKTVEEAQALTAPFYKDPKLARRMLSSAEAKIKSYPQADPRKIAAIGYCFGGTMVLDGATQGMDFKAVVSFHGGLKGVTATKGTVRGKIFICQGGADKFVSDSDLIVFRANMAAAGVRVISKVYPGAGHAFTNPAATANGKKFNLPIAYNEEADRASWQDMRKFLRDVFYGK